MSDNTKQVAIDSNLQQQDQLQTETPAVNPDELHGFHIEAFLKIFDPTTQEVFVSTRA